MKFNFFEGARRISLLIAAAWVVGWVAYPIFSTPYVSTTYTLFFFDGPAVPVDSCTGDFHLANESVAMPDGRKVYVNFCFIAKKASNGEMLIPYADAGNGKELMNRPYSSEVSNYADSFAKKFKVPTEDLDGLEAKYRAARLELWTFAAQFLFGGLAVGFGFVAAVGWIVRGFFGIPRGKDFRPTE